MDYESISDIIERYLIYNFDQNTINEIVVECGLFLKNKGIHNDILNYFAAEFEVSYDGSCVRIFGRNLMSSLWIINVYPKNPEKYIIENECIFQDKKYIYEPRKKTLKIKEWKKKI